MSKKHKMAYVPKIVIDEVEDIMQEEQLDTGADAFRKMTEYAKVGREVKRIATLNWPRPRKRWKKRKDLMQGGLF